MFTSSNTLADYRTFAGVAESWELVRTGLIVVSGTMYRLELWHSYSNADIPYYVSIYTDHDGVWRRMADAPFPIAPSGEEAMRSAMAFLTQRAA